MHRLPVFKIIVDTYAFVWHERQHFFSLAFPAILVLAVLGLVTLPTSSNGVSVSGGTIVFGIVSGLLFFAYWVLFSVTWHRRYLILDEAPSVGAALRWGPRQTQFLLLVIRVGGLLVLIFLGGGLLLSLVSSGVGGPLTFLVPFLVVASVWLIGARLSLLFPAMAVDHRMTFSECWEFTRGNGWRLFFIIFPVELPVGLIDRIASLMSISTGSLIANFVGTLVDVTLWIFGTALGISVLSIAYRALVAGRQTASLTEG